MFGRILWKVIDCLNNFRDDTNSHKNIKIICLLSIIIKKTSDLNYTKAILCSDSLAYNSLSLCTSLACPCIIYPSHVANCVAWAPSTTHITHSTYFEILSIPTLRRGVGYFNANSYIIFSTSRRKATDRSKNGFMGCIHRPEF
jgi:hypothetical protein